MSESDRIVRVGIVQMAMGPSREDNLAKAAKLVAEAAADGARVVVLPELFADRYVGQRMDAALYDLAEEVPGGEVSRALAEMAREHQVTLVGGVFERAAEGLLFNTSVALSPDGSLLGKYRKVHIPHGPGYEEKFYFAPGDLGYRVVPVPQSDLKVGLAVCWDQWFPEVGRTLGLGGAEMIAFPTAIGDEPTAPGFSSRESWIIACRAQALFNQVFVAAVNRTGTEEVLRFFGGSFVSDPWGNVLVQAGEDDEGVSVAECDLGLIRRARALFQFYRDRRPDTYGAIVRLSPEERQP
jgi:N-carbamoylputrescine amidase